MLIYITKDAVKLGLKGQIIKVKDGFGRHIIAQGGAVEVTKKNEARYRKVEVNAAAVKSAVATKTSLLAEKIKSAKVILKKRVHNEGALYAAVNASDIADALADQGIVVKKSQVQMNKSIKKCGSYEVTIRLSSSLLAPLKVQVSPGKA